MVSFAIKTEAFVVWNEYVYYFSTTYLFKYEFDMYLIMTPNMINFLLNIGFGINRNTVIINFDDGLNYLPSVEP